MGSFLFIFFIILAKPNYLILTIIYFKKICCNILNVFLHLLNIY